MAFLRLSIITASLCLLAGGVSAEIYQFTDKDGNVVFSDEPAAGATPVDLPPLPTYSPPKITKTDPAAPASAEPAAPGYQTLVIGQPGQDATIRDNTGAVRVSVNLTPALNRSAGHRFQYYLNGAATGEPVASPQTGFANVERGAHQVEAAVVDSSGKELIRSDSVRFYVHRQTVNSPARTKPAPR